MSNISIVINSMFLQIKIIILAGLTVLGLLINYEKVGEGFLFFPTIKNPSLAFISLERKPESFIFAQQKSWGWPFVYWQANEFNLKSLIFNLIFYLIIWAIFLFIIWFIKGVIKLQKKRFKPPQIKL